MAIRAFSPGFTVVTGVDTSHICEFFQPIVALADSAGCMG